MVIPNWLASLLGEKFFNPCLLHECAKKNEKKIFCLDYCSTICPHCLPTHRLLQIRRYVYHDFVRLDDVEKLMDCSFVQAYTTNSAKVIFLNQRPQTRPFRGSGNICSTCDRSLPDPYLFCSLSCKVKLSSGNRRWGVKPSVRMRISPIIRSTKSIRSLHILLSSSSTSISSSSL